VKLILISIVVLFGILTFVFLLFPNHIQVNRITAINAPEAKLMRLVRDTSSWKNWNKFYVGDKPASVTMYIIKDSVNAFSTRWIRSNGKSFNGNFTITPVDQGNMVQWTLDFPLHWYPWERMSAMFYEKQFGPEMEATLQELKKLAEHE